MSDMREEMLRTLDRIVEDTVTLKMREAADERGSQDAGVGGAEKSVATTAPLWSALDEAGIAALGVSGGEADVSFADTMELVRRAAYHALPVAIGDTIIARRVRSAHGLPEVAGPSAIAPPAGSKGVMLEGQALTGYVSEVPWGRDLAQLIVAVEGANDAHLVALDCAGAVSRRGRNMAGEPRDVIDLAKCKVIDTRAVTDAVHLIEAEGALLRAVQMSGALSAALEHCVTWVGDRVQFGKPISKHQAIQHLMAQLAEEVAAGSAAADLAIQASEGALDRFAIAVAKARVGEAAGKAANIAHAVFGAMGFTREHQLHYATRRLWAWRNEFGGEIYWQRELGHFVASRGGTSLWATLTAKG